MENAEAMRIMKNMATARYDYVRFTFVDFHGITRSKTVPKARIKQFFLEGCSFFAGAIGMSLVGPMVPRDTPDIKHTNSGNVWARPQPGTLHTLPLNGGPCRMGEVICETYFANNMPQASNPRTMARNQLQMLRRCGFELLSSWELEVTLVNEDSLEPNFNRSIMSFTNQVYDSMEELLLVAEKAFSEMGIDLETLQAEASPGQYEFVTKPTKGIRQADNLVVMKDALRQVAKRYHKKAIFMTKIFPQPGYSSALHLNHSLWCFNNRNQFWDYSNDIRLAATCRHWVAGLLKHARALTALTCPTVNCYRRLHNSIAPTRADWGIDARLACCRLKNYRPDQTYVEFRLPSGSANPYIVMAATVAAGIDGLKNKYKLPTPIGEYDLEKCKAPSDDRNKQTEKGDSATVEPAAKKMKPNEEDPNNDSMETEVSKDIAGGDVSKGGGAISMETSGLGASKEPTEEKVKPKEEKPDNNTKETDVSEAKSGQVDRNGCEDTNSSEVNVESEAAGGNEDEQEEEEEISSYGELPHTLEEALQALEADEVIVEALGIRFVQWFTEIKRNEIKHFEGFEDLTDEQLLLKERECYMNVL